MFYAIVGGMLGTILLIGLIAQVQKRGRESFSPSPPQGDFTESERYGSGPNGL